MSVTAIFGGTFNPFHMGHYEMLSAVNRLSLVDKVLLMPDNVPPHKVCDFLASDHDRIKMCSIICEDFKKTQLELLEFEREGKSYTFDTVCLLEEKYPNEKFYFVCGGDMITSLNTWYKWDRLIKKVGFIAFKRQGEDEDFNKAVEALRENGAEIYVMPDVITEVSSTELRKAINSEKSRSLLPFEIYKYIIEKGIYNV